MSVPKPAPNFCAKHLHPKKHGEGFPRGQPLFVLNNLVKHANLVPETLKNCMMKQTFT